MRKVLVTGATGFLGQWLLKTMRSIEPNVQIAILSRNETNKVGAEIVYKADLSVWNSALDDSELQRIRSEKFDTLIHLAGLYNLRVSLEDAYLQNVFGTHNALQIAEMARIPNFVHASTVAVTMGHQHHFDLHAIDASLRRPEFQGGITENSAEQPIQPDQEFSGPFPDHYATTKAQAEKLVRNWTGEFPKRKLILRPGILMGDTQLGTILRIDGPYHALDSFRRMRSLLKTWPGPIFLPGHTDRKIPLVPVDLAAKAIAKFIKHFEISDTPIQSYYVAPSNGPTIAELYKSALEHLGINNEVMIASGVPSAIAKPAAEWVARLPREEIEYVLNLPVLDYTTSDKILGRDFYPAFANIASTIWRGFDGYAQNR